MKRRYTLWMALLLVLAVLAGCAAPAAETNDTPAAPETGTDSGGDTKAEDTPEEAEDTLAVQPVLADFSAVTLDGGSFTQEDLAARDVTILNFWTTQCGPCIDEMPELAEYAAALPETVQLATVCLDGSGREETVQEILDEAGFAGVTLLSGDGDFPWLCSAVQYTPTTIFVDSKGDMIGGAIIGRQSDLAGIYTMALNQVLESLGKEGISLDG